VEEAPFVVGAIFGLSLYGRHVRDIGEMGHARRHSLAWFALAAFVVVQVCYALYLEELGQMFWNRVRFLANLAGAFWLVVFVAARDGRWIRMIAPLGRATYFAYLSHQLILDACKGQLTKLPGYGALWFAFASSLGIFALAVGLGLMVARVRLLRWLSP
jgi:hypothetical protein